jgi:hypothetical protein
MGSRGKFPLIFNIPPDGGEWLTAHVGCFTPGKELQYPWNRRLVGPPLRLDMFGEEKDLLLILGFEPLTIQPIA